MPEETDLGRIEISPTAIATLASQVVLECYGVVGLATKGRGVVRLLEEKSAHKGVEVNVIDDQIIINLYVVMEYGVRISEVAHNVMARVKFALEKALGLPVAQVNVYVQELRVSSPD